MGEDERLYRGAISGDPEAVHGLMERYGDRLTRYLCGFTQEEREAEDLMVEAFARLFKARPSLTQPGSFRTALFEIGRELASGSGTGASGFRYERLRPRPGVDLLAREPGKERLYEYLDGACDDSELVWLIYMEGMNLSQAVQVLHLTGQRRTELLTRWSAARPCPVCFGTDTYQAGKILKLVDREQVMIQRYYCRRCKAYFE